MTLSRVVSEILNAEKHHDLEIPLKGQSRSLKVVPFNRLGMVSYQCSIQICRNLENQVRVRQGHWKVTIRQRAYDLLL